MSRAIINRTPMRLVFMIVAGLLSWANLLSQPAKNRIQDEPHGRLLLYISTNKVQYVPTETIWFVGYVLETQSNDDGLKADILSVALVREDDGYVQLHKDYLIDNDICSGSLTLPDTLADGAYVLMAYTNIVDSDERPVHFYRTPITVLRNEPTVIHTDLHLLADRSDKDTLYVHAKVFFPGTITFNDRHKAVIGYHVQGSQQRKVGVDVIGEAVLPVPVQDVRGSDHVLHMTVKAGKTDKSIRIKLPELPPDETVVEFYPEGGELSIGIPNRVAWKVRPAWGEEAESKAMLLEDGRVLDTIAADRDGVGIITMEPRTAKSYAIKLIGSDRVYALPQPRQSDFPVSMVRAVAADTLALIIGATDVKFVKLAITDLYSGTSPQVSDPIPITKKGRILIPLHHVLQGLNVLTVLDTSDRALARRVFFAHHNKENTVTIDTDTNHYDTRDSVFFSVSIRNDQGEPISGLLSLTCVQVERLDSSSNQRIANHYLMSPFISDGRSGALYGGPSDEDPDQLEKRLRMANMEADPFLSNPKGRSASLTRAGLSGRIELLKKKRQPLSMFVTTNMIPIELSADDTFELQGKDICIPEDQFFIVMVKEGDQVVPHPRIYMDRSVRDDRTFLAESALGVMKLGTAKTKMRQIKQRTSLDMVQQLETVTVTRKRGLHSYSYGANDCGDWVCGANYLNCSTHPANMPGTTRPQEGEAYYSEGRIGKFIYEGCNYDRTIDGIRPIYTSRPFYGMLGDESASTETAHYMSTLLWKPFEVLVADDQPAKTYCFMTSDLKGKFKIRVEGMTTSGGFLYGEKIITVGQNSNVISR